MNHEENSAEDRNSMLLGNKTGQKAATSTLMKAFGKELRGNSGIEAVE